MTADKRQLRRLALARRRRQADHVSLSGRILERLVARPEFVAARSVLWYVSAGSEVATWDALRLALTGDRQLAVPYCEGDVLQLVWLKSIDELEPGQFGIHEPRPALRRLADRRLDVTQVDLIVLPGVAFDARGARLGHGRGYYDRLLQKARPDTPLFAPAFECQMFERVPTEPHDVLLDLVITERQVYVGHRGRPQA